MANLVYTKIGLGGRTFSHRDPHGQNPIKSGVPRISGATQVDSIYPSIFSPVRRRLGGNLSHSPECHHVRP
jgi:hypothetical protein